MLVTCEGVVSNVDRRLHFIRHGNTYIEAGRPYLIKPSKDVECLSFRNVTIEGGTVIKEWDSENKEMKDGSIKVPDRERFFVDVNDNEYKFKGVYMRTTVPTASYITSGTGDNNGLHRVGAAASGYVNKIGGYRAFFEPVASVAQGQSLLVAFSITDFIDGDQVDGGLPTGIISVDEDGSIREVPVNAGVYTISGQKISNNPLDLNSAASGLYIINGKKYIK